MTTILTVVILLCLFVFVALWSWAMCRAAALADAEWDHFITSGGWSEISLGHTQSPARSNNVEQPGVSHCHRSSAVLEAMVEPPHLAVRMVSALGAAFGIAGAFLIAMPAVPGWGFMAFAVSNIAWLIVSHMQRQTAQHVQQWVFLACSLLGVWNWGLRPLALG